jgi:hypothetical protein
MLRTEMQEKSMNYNKRFKMIPEISHIHKIKSNINHKI